MTLNIGESHADFEKRSILLGCEWELCIALGG